MKRQKIAIFGCGWLGEPLAMKLMQRGFQVSVCRRDPQQVERLKQQGLDAYAIEVDQAGIVGDLSGWAANAELAIVMLPPRSKTQAGDVYIKQIQQLVIGLKSQAITKVMFISSTGVYASGDYQLTELSPLKDDSPLVAAEQAIQAAFSSIVIRFSGLVNENRTPGRFLAGKQLSAGQTPANLIHQADCIAMMTGLLAQPWQSNVYNASTEHGPSRAKLYTLATKQLGLPAPTFSDEGSQPHRCVSCQKLVQQLDYQFIYPDILKWLTDET